MAADDPDSGGMLAWSHDVGTALRRLDATQRRILRLTYLERRSRDEVAAELRVTPGVVSRALALGLQAFTLAVLNPAGE